MEEKCENLMNIVVESRKKFGKMCVDYEQKSSLMENKLLNLQLDTISNYRLKSKNKPSNVDVEDMLKDIEDFSEEITVQRKRVEHLRKTIKNTQEIVLQLKSDRIGRKMHQSLSAEAMLLQAKKKIQ